MGIGTGMIGRRAGMDGPGLEGRIRLARLRQVVCEVQTPAFVIDEPAIVGSARLGSKLARSCGFRLLYALKPLPDSLVLSLMAPWLDGFSASSTFEARLARKVLEGLGSASGEASVHMTSPGLRG